MGKTAYHSCGSRACPALVAGNPVPKIMVHCLRRDGAWIPVFAGMTEMVGETSFQKAIVL